MLCPAELQRKSGRAFLANHAGLCRCSLRDEVADGLSPCLELQNRKTASASFPVRPYTGSIVPDMSMQAGIASRGVLRSAPASAITGDRCGLLSDTRTMACPIGRRRSGAKQVFPQRAPREIARTTEVYYKSARNPVRLRRSRCRAHRSDAIDRRKVQQTAQRHWVARAPRSLVCALWR